MGMAIEVQCAGCGHAFAVDDKFAGKQGRCAKCGHVVSVAGAAASDTFADGQTDWGRLLGAVEDSAPATGPQVVAAPQVATSPPPLRPASSRGAPSPRYGHPNTAFNESAGVPSASASQASGGSRASALLIKALCIIMTLSSAAALGFALMRLDLLAWLFILPASFILVPALLWAHFKIVGMAFEESSSTGWRVVFSHWFPYTYAKAHAERTGTIRMIWLAGFISGALLLGAFYVLDNIP